MESIPHIKVNGIDIFYEKRGAGKPLYILHDGPGFDHRYFSNSLTELEDIRELYYIDFRGHGKSSKAGKKSYNIYTFTSDIEALRSELGHSSIDILGHSMGGFVGILFAIMHTGHLDSLILVSVPPEHGGIKGNYSLKARQLLLKSRHFFKKKRKIGKKDIDRDALVRDILLMSWKNYVPERLHSQYSDYIRSLQNLEIFFDMQKELIDFTAVDKLEYIKQPTLVIFGEDDIFIKRGRKLKDIKNSRFSVIPSVKHLPFLEDKEYFNMVVREFLTGKML